MPSSVLRRSPYYDIWLVALSIGERGGREWTDESYDDPQLADDDNGDHEYNDDGGQRYEENTNMDDDDDGRQKHIYVTAQERNGCHLNT